MEQAADSDKPEVQPGNLLIVRLFYAVSTQWLTAGMSGTRTGLNYPAVEARARYLPGFKALDNEQQNLVWEGLQQMELAALGVWSNKED